MAGQAALDKARRGSDRQGRDRLDVARQAGLDVATFGMARKGTAGKARFVAVRLDETRRGWRDKE